MYGREHYIATFNQQPEDDLEKWAVWVAGWVHAKNDAPDITYVTDYEGQEMEYVEEPRMLPVTALKVNGIRYDVVEAKQYNQELPVNVEAVIKTAINWGRVYGAILDNDKWEDMYPTAASRFSAALIPGTIQVKLSLANQILLNELFDLEIVGPERASNDPATTWQEACEACAKVISDMDSETHDDTFVRFAHDLAALIHKHKDAIENEYDLNVLVYSFINDFK